MIPGRRVRKRGTSAGAALALLSTLLVAACGTDLLGASGSGAPTGSGGPAEPLDRIHRQAHDALERWAAAVRQSGGADITFVGDLTGQIGTWELGQGDNNKKALMAGLVDAARPLSEDVPGRQAVKWVDGTSVDVNLLSAAAALDALVEEGTERGTAVCDRCSRLVVTEAKLATSLVETSRGPAETPTWVFTVQGSSVRITRVAVDGSITVDPPPWNAADPPIGLSIQGAIGKAGSRKLTVSFLGAPDAGDVPCGADYTVEAVESELAVVVIVEEHRNPADAVCPLAGRIRTAELTLVDQLGKRAVLEVRQGLPVAVEAPD